MGHRYSREFTYADDLTLFYRSHSGLSVLISECKMYAAEYNIMLMVTRVNYCVLSVDFYASNDHLHQEFLTLSQIPLRQTFCAVPCDLSSAGLRLSCHHNSEPRPIPLKEMLHFRHQLLFQYSAQVRKKVSSTCTHTQ